MVKLKAFSKFENTTEALAAATALVESKLSKGAASASVSQSVSQHKGSFCRTQQRMFAKGHGQMQPKSDVARQARSWACWG